MGTPGYIAPEVRRGDSATPASDQFAFCVSLFEAIYGRRPDEPAPAGGATPARTPATISGPATSITTVRRNGHVECHRRSAARAAGDPAPGPRTRRGGAPPVDGVDDRSAGSLERRRPRGRHARRAARTRGDPGPILLLSMAIATMIIWRGHGRTIATARDAFFFALAPSSIILVGLFATRRALGRSQLNRQFRAIVALTVIAFLGHRALAIRWSTPVPSLLAGDAYLMGVIVAVAAVSLERWMALMAAMLFAGALGGDLVAGPRRSSLRRGDVRGHRLRGPALEAEPPPLLLSSPRPPAARAFDAPPAALRSRKRRRRP